jgi:hypothetical protein
VAGCLRSQKGLADVYYWALFQGWQTLASSLEEAAGSQGPAGVAVIARPSELAGLLRGAL